MLGATYIQRRSKTGGYWFRRRVPDHLRPVIGKNEITRSLGTKSLSEAKRRSRSYANATDDLFEKASQSTFRDMNEGTASEPVAPVSSSTPPEGRRAWIDEFIKARLAGDQGIVMNADTHAAADSAIAPSAPQKAFPTTTSSASTVPPVIAMPRRLATDHAGGIVLRQRVATVQEMFDRYLAEFERRPRTERTWRSHLDMFLQLSGLSWQSHIHTVTDAHVEDYILALRKLPARRQESFYRGLSMRQIIAKFGERSDLQKLDQKTISNRVDSLRAIFNYALRHKYIAENPFVGKTNKRANRKAAIKKRLPFDHDDLKTLFSSELFSPPSAEWGSKAWIPVIACYTGCRLEEIGQLRVGDFRMRNGIPYLAITETDLGGEGDHHGDDSVRGKALKTESSEREVPLHPVLCRLGFPDLVNRMRRRGERRLFPDIRSAGDEVTAAYSKWFGRYLNRISITSPLKVFHSFRHGFKDACRNGGVPREIAEVLMGHTGRTVGDGYGRGYSLDVLGHEISKVSFGLAWETDA